MLNNKVIWSIKSECGPLRDKNEDSVYPHSSGKSMLPFKAGVFDGMGGHRSGEIASKIASETMNENFDSLDLYINEANKEILSHQNSNPETYGMGTTMTVIEITEDLLLKIAHVGDSRCYVFSDNKLFYLLKTIIYQKTKIY